MHQASVRPRGDIEVGHLLVAAGIDPGDVLVLRHTFKIDGLAGPEDLTPEKVLAYTRSQGAANARFAVRPPRYWLIFVADGGLRSRFFCTYENFGEIEVESTPALRFFDLRGSDLFDNFRDRLVIEWSRDAVNWVKTGAAVARFSVIEIADPAHAPFPGYDRLVIDYATLTEVVSSSRYRSWQAALAAVQGVYLITDARTGMHYVGKADGAEGLLGRWAAYARTGHGGNVALLEAVGVDAEHARQFRFSILRVFGPETPQSEIDAAETHYKRAMMSREFGYNRN